MATVITGRYQGKKRIELTHVDSGASFLTDAPLDNNGEGGSFSPTDLVGASLASCVLTIMAIRAEKLEVSDFPAAHFQVTKEMSVDPRRVGKLTLEFHLPASLSEKERTILEKAGSECPVHYSVHPDIEVNLNFIYDL